MRKWLPVAVAAFSLLGAGCGSGPVTNRVVPGTYAALVPSTAQFSTEMARDIPGGFVTLHQAGTRRVDLRVDGDLLTFTLDDGPSISRSVVERRSVTDREGSGPLKARKEVLLLGEPLVLGNLEIPDPVIWPGSFDGSPVITLKQYDAGERGPGVACLAAEPCLLLSSGVDASGDFERIALPGGKQDAIASIRIAGDLVVFTLEDGRHVQAPPGGRSSSRSCGLAESPIWEVPSGLGLPMADPVLVHTLCPSNPGASIQLIIMERAAIPVLVPLAADSDGEWCNNSPTCLWFAPA
ncbi:MAG: hypothetical protein R3B97_04360 [Dehalococcoidia bacterium]|nr:hypothetical protein [Dehalococcoidia bacterium]